MGQVHISAMYVQGQGHRCYFIKKKKTFVMDVVLLIYKYDNIFDKFACQHVGPKSRSQLHVDH